MKINMIQLNEGDKAPDFMLLNQKGKEIKLSTFLGKKVILFFYPKDNTPACTKEACNINDNYKAIKSENTEVFGISPDSAKKHLKFIEKFGFRYDLLVDDEKKVLNLYGCWGEKKFMGRTYDGVHRTTFIIDENGYIEHIIREVKTKSHGEDLLKLLQQEVV